MKNRNFGTALVLLFLVQNLSSAGELFATPSFGDTRIDRNVSQEKTISGPSANAILDGCVVRPLHFSDGIEAAVSL